MSIPHLYTKEELDVEIAQAKKDYAAARRAISYSHQSGNQVERERVDKLWQVLQDLQRERVKLYGVVGPQPVVGRVRRA